MPPNDRFIKHANLMSSLTILSRIFGLLRDKLWSAYLGLGPEFSAFWMGFQFPNLFRRIFGEGALTGVFLPVYTRIQKEQGQDAANKLASATTTLLFLVLGAITLLGEMILLPFAFSHSISPNNALTALMLAIMLPYCMMICAVALFSAIASVHEKFTAQSLSPIILNLLAAAAALLPVLLFTRSYPLGKRVIWVACSVLLAGILQLLQMLPTLKKSGVKLSFLLDKNSGIRDVIKPLLPMIVGYSAVQFNTFLDGQIAYWLSPDGHNNHPTMQLLGHLITLPLGPGALAKLSAAQRLYLLPVGIFGVSMATALFPALSRAASANDIPELKRLLIAGLRKTFFLSIPASFGMILIANLLVTLIYSGRTVSLADIDRAAWATIWFCAGIWAFEAQLVILRVFYALRDVKTPMRIAVAMIALNLSFNLTLVWFMQEGGIALSTTLAAILQSAILLTLLRKRLGRLGLRAILPSLGKSLLATLIMLECGLLLLHIPLPWEHAPITTQSRLLTALIKLPLLVTASAAIYFLITHFLNTPELADVPLLHRLLKRKPR